MKNKKGVELTMNTMIIAIISLIVLAVILIIFSDIITENVDGMHGISECAARGDNAGCIASDEPCEGTKLPRVGGCKEPEPICCTEKP